MAYIKGSRYGDDIDGSDFDDIIEGFGGHDRIWGHGGDDDLYGGSGDDDLFGGSGDDNLHGGSGWDYMEGGTGADYYFVDSVNDEVVEFAGEGVDRVYTLTSSYRLPANVEDLVYDGYGDFTGIGNGLANFIHGGDRHDRLEGLAGNDRLYGYAGDDDLYGGSGADRLSGGAGYDFLFGGSGNDILTGGSGTDDFHFDTALNASSNVDRITDFSVDSDAIYLDRDIFRGIAASGQLDPDAYVEGSVARDAEDRIVYDQANGRIFYDRDGTGAAAKILFATVTPGTDLEAIDFYGYI
jgi:serralysin